LENSKKHILYSILDWGLGHATRSIPLIEEVLKSNVKISLCGEGSTGHLIQSVFPNLPFYPIQGIQIKYPTNMSMSMAMILQAPGIAMAIRKEHRKILTLVKDLKVDAIISDNRYGAYAPGIPSVIITHQLNVQAPKNKDWLRPYINKVNHHYLKKFDHIWVPDSEGENNLTAELSHDVSTVKKLNPTFIGSLSRFHAEMQTSNYTRYDAIAVLSGPEPQRSLFEKLLVEQLQSLSITSILVKGTPQFPKQEQKGNCKITSHISTDEMLFHYRNCKYIISRSGHSTLMDLCAVQKSAICIATPGQTEQEFLAELHAKNKHIVSFAQDQIDLKSGMDQLNTCMPFQIPVNTDFKEVLKKFLENI